MQQAELAGLEVHAAWVNKAMQLHQLSKTHSTLIVAGESSVNNFILNYGFPLLQSDYR